MITTLTIASAQVGVCPIEPSDSRLSRRLRERRAVERILQAMLGHARLDHLPDGAPIADGARFISISHSRRLAAVAISQSAPLGIDAEEDRRATLLRVAPKFLSDRERQWVGEADLVRAWTIKEAVYKAAGQPSLTATEGIRLLPALQGAEAAGRVYACESVWLGPTLLTVATPLYSESMK